MVTTTGAQTEPHVPRWQARVQPLLQGDRARRDLFGNGLAQDRLAVTIDYDVLALVRQFGVELVGSVCQPLAQMAHEVTASRGHAELVAVIRQLLLALPPSQQVIAIVGVCVGARYA